MNTNIDSDEVAKFSGHAEQWWDMEGPLRTLHDINPARMAYIESQVKLQGQRVLDLGCGGGVLSEGMAKLGAHVTGLDVSPEAITVAKAHAESADLSIDYYCEAIETFNSELFPVITCLEMLEHVPDPAVVLEHAARLLMPGGYLFLSTIHRSLKAYATVILAAEYALGLLPRQTHDYQRFIKPSELATMVRAVGLELVGLTGLAYHPFNRSASLTADVSANFLLVCRS
ncbi:MAG: bifunctional 2-polyprenyl-6-hydroxyphenol methylase/3-demethylubiquinol 3-O-methyltransferase UbiG [Gammaproteobacteria bacterium]|nr:bifunctional 2-polyprenyl-6-hydroxyphenol methylase/3-demethylubiquinol 3-O-methyltransferase UbiG [Gammaproteobacteria bacterium]